MTTELTDLHHESIRTNLVRLMEERWWSEQRTANHAEVDLRTIQRIKKTGHASEPALHGLAKAFGVAITDLLNPDPQTAMKRFIRMSNEDQLKVLDCLAGYSPCPVEHSQLARLVGETNFCHVHARLYENWAALFVGRPAEPFWEDDVGMMSLTENMGGWFFAYVRELRGLH